MNDKRIGPIRIEKDIFRPASQIRYTPSRQALLKTRRKRHAQIRPAGLDAGENAAFQGRDQATADGFDFG
jgi:hypothetical protein